MEHGFALSVPLPMLADNVDAWVKEVKMAKSGASGGVVAK